MDFDPCEHQKTQIIIKAGAIIRQLKGLPVENNITLLDIETRVLLGIPPGQLNSKMSDHLPSPAEMRTAIGTFIIPNRPCPKCGKTTFLNSICQSCEDAKDESGNVVYKSGYTCNKQTGGCGFVDEKSGEWITQRLSKMGIEVPTGTKESLGIMTKTDEGLK